MGLIASNFQINFTMSNVNGNNKNSCDIQPPFVNERQKSARNKKSGKRKNTDDQNVTSPLSKRTRFRTNRYGKRVSTVDRDEFFENIRSSEINNHDTNEVLNNANDMVNDGSTVNDDMMSDGTNGSTAVLESEYIPESGSADSDCSDRDSPVSEMSILSVSSFRGTTIKSPSFEKAVLAKLDEVLTRLAMLEKNSAKTIVHLKDLEVSKSLTECSVESPGRVDNSELEMFGLPINDKESLAELEEQLKSKHFKSKLVSLCRNQEKKTFDFTNRHFHYRSKLSK